LPTLTPYPVQGLTAEQADGNILLSWDSSLSATSYVVSRSTDGVNYSTIATVGLVNQYVDSFPGVGVMYYYTITAVTSVGHFATATLTFSGQPNNGDTVSIANVVLTAGTSFAVGTTYLMTLANLLAAVNSNASLANVVTAASAGSVITIAAANVGSEGNGLQLANALTNVTSTPFATGVNPVAAQPSLPAQMVAAPPSEMSLYELRLRSQQCADRVNSSFVTTDEWNSFLRLAMYELYDLLVTTYEDYFALSQVNIQTNGTLSLYPLPDGVTNYLGGNFNGTSGAPAKAFYKATGVDLNVNTSTVTPSRVSLLKFEFIKRNQYVYPNSTSTIYGVYNMRYRVMDNSLNIIPTPAGSQNLILWYTPKLPALLADIDLTTLGFSGWLRYVIVRAAMYALDKEEGSDTSKLQGEILFLKKRIEESAANRDAGIPDKISETRTDPCYQGTGFGGGSSSGGGW
jgi:hypothetical protein